MPRLRGKLPENGGGLASLSVARSNEKPDSTSFLIAFYARDVETRRVFAGVAGAVGMPPLSAWMIGHIGRSPLRQASARCRSVAIIS